MEEKAGVCKNCEYNLSCYEMEYGKFDIRWKCSHCGHSTNYSGVKKLFNFCPMCGMEIVYNEISYNAIKWIKLEDTHVCPMDGIKGVPYVSEKEKQIEKQPEKQPVNMF